MLLASTTLLSGCAGIIAEDSYISESTSQVANQAQYKAYRQNPTPLSPNTASNNTSPKAASTQRSSKIIALDGLGQSNNIQLRRQITQALVISPNIKAQQAQVEQARQQVIINAADQGLNLSLNNNNSLRTSAQSSSATKSFDLALQGSWNADLWGTLSAQTKIAQLQLSQSNINLEQAKNTLIADITSAWYQLIYNQALLKLTQEQQANTKDQLAAIETSYQRGLSESLDVFLARGNFESAQSSTIARQQALASAARDLEQLLTKYPTGKLLINAKLTKLQADYRLGVPADLLKNRADLRSSWQGLLIEDARVAASYAQQFPQFSLTGNLSLTNARLSDLFKENLAWSLASAISQTVFDNGKKKAQYQQAKAKLLAAEQQFLLTLQGAIKEVETLLYAEKSIAQQIARQLRTLKNTLLSYEQVQIQYQNGIANYQQVLNLQQQLFNNQRSQLDLEMQQIDNRVKLILALGSQTPSSNLTGIQ